ncbi:MAG: HyaD/HybD family hydrogenase maturation endopeptidase [Desulfobulbaceae bacterium]|nr:HyaD/HybD family hydrogenase maturation endopeptidase [Desulfobulbaceae bacterium]
MSGKKEGWEERERAGLDVLVLGIGNILLGDEGLGVRAVEEFRRRYAMPQQLTVVDGGTMGIELLPYVVGRSHLLLVDALQGDGQPGQVKRIHIDSPPAFFRNRSTPHQIGMADVLGLAAMTDELPASVTLYGVTPTTLNTGLELSQQAREGIDSLLRLLVDDLAGLGLGLEPRRADTDGR